MKDEGWEAVVMEVQLAIEVGFCAVWLLALFIYGASFR